MTLIDEKYGRILAIVLDAARGSAESMQGSQDLLQQGEILAYEHILEVALEGAEMESVDPYDLGMDGFDPISLLRDCKIDKL
ncbi:MAG: hypothetical protein KZQ89_01605 [Candidatus Thiodiazotropha sp. (ex Lucinoma kastoroae)]|nr:hypothetical protein [Candidatus Thiodiazotropha sp. (ex Lucinoma kastoroae)]